MEGMLDERADQMRRAIELQPGMLPASPLNEDGFELAAHFTAAKEISGDFYDWYRPDNGHLVVTLGDVMGKGLREALMMATARAALRVSAGIEQRDDGVKRASEVMSAALEVNPAYVRVFHAVYEPMSGLLRYVDAGHGHARLLRGATGQETLPLRSAPIGIFPDTQFVVGTATLNPGDALVGFSYAPLHLRPAPPTQKLPL